MHQITVTPTEIREAWTTIVAGSNPFTARQDKSATVRRFDDYRATQSDRWIGATGAEIQHRLDHGYHVEANGAQIGGHEDYTMPTVWLDEEQGDLLVDQVIGGEDLYRVQWTDQAAPKSLTIRANIGMASETEPEVIGAYMEWVLSVADAARRNGAVPSIELVIGSKKCFDDQRRGNALEVSIPVVTAGEMVDEVSWRAYLTPGAFRTLGFVALALGADKAQRGLTTGMGQPATKGWDVRFEDDILDIECPMSANAFDAGLMDRLLAEVY